MGRLGDAEREAPAASGQVFDPLGPLLDRPVLKHQQQADVVPDYRVLVLQVAVQPEALAREMLADDRHAEVAAVLAAVLGWKCVALVPRRIGPAHRLAQQCLPVPAWKAAAVPVGTGVLAAVVEEPDVVVGLFEWPDLAGDKG